MLDVSIYEVKEAMDWYRALSPQEKLHHRKNIKSQDAISIARYWKANIKRGVK